MSSSFQQNWIHSIRTSFAKVMAVQVLLFGSGPEMVRSLRSHRSLRPKGPGHSGPVFFGALCSFCGAVLYWGPEVPRRWYGVSGPSESPAQRTRNLRPQASSQPFSSSSLIRRRTTSSGAGALCTFRGQYHQSDGGGDGCFSGDVFRFLGYSRREIGRASCRERVYVLV